MFSHEELEERCKHYISLESTDSNRLSAVLERKLKTVNFKVMPDKSIRFIWRESACGSFAGKYDQRPE